MHGAVSARPALLLLLSGTLHLPAAMSLAACAHSLALILPCPLQIRDLQQAAVASWLMKEARISERQQQHDPDTVHLYCVNCGVAVCRGSDIRTVEGIHHVNVNPSFG